MGNFENLLSLNFGMKTHGYDFVLLFTLTAFEFTAKLTKVMCSFDYNSGFLL